MRRLGIVVGLGALAAWFVLVHGLTHHYIGGQSYTFIFWHLVIAVVLAVLVGLGVWLYERSTRLHGARAGV